MNLMRMFPMVDVEGSMNEVLELQKKMIRGASLMMEMGEDDKVNVTPKEVVFKEDKLKLYRYVSNEDQCGTPTLVVYALVNRQYMMDIQPDKSVIAGFLEKGLDIYMIDWGYPTQDDKYLTMDDYINGYIDDCVDHIRSTRKVDKINLLGVCQGGTFSVIYTALHPEKVKNLVTMVSPIDFGIENGLLFNWGRHLNIDNMVDTMGIIPGSMMNNAYMMLKPFQLMLDKYVSMAENMDDPVALSNFLRMEKWIFDSPGQAGETIRQFIKDLYQGNKLVKGELEIGGQLVDLKRIDVPLLNVYAEYDHLVPPEASIPLNDHVSSTDKEIMAFPVGHIGMYVSSRSKKEIVPVISDWLLSRS